MSNLSDFSKNVLTLVSGTSLAQVITLLASFVLARIYTPVEFGVYSFFISVVAVLGPNINGRFENAIILPKNEKEAYNIVWLSLIINSAFSIGLLILIVIFKTYFLAAFNIKALGFWIYFIPIVVWFTGIYNSLSLLNTRLKNFKQIAQTLIYRTLSSTSSQVGLKYIFKAFNGLILGNIISQFVGNLKLIKSAGGLSNIISFYDKDVIKEMAYKYIDFPKFSLPGSLLNTVTRNVLNIATPRMYSVSIVGQYSLVKRLLALPSSFISSSISKVFLEASDKEKKSVGNALKILKETLFKLIVLSLLFYGVLYFIVEDIFVLFYGEIWRDAGVYAQILLPSFAAAFIVSPVSVIMEIFEKQRLFLMWQIFNFVSVIGVLYFSYSQSLSFVSFLSYFNWVIVFQYSVLLILILKTAKGKQ